MKTHLGVFTMNSLDNNSNVATQTESYCTNNPELTEQIEQYHNAFKCIYDLIPQTTDNLFSGNLFPYFEMEYELEASILFVEYGYYKHALIALRNVLELGTLSTYFDIDGKSYIDIKPWLKAQSSTPFKNEVKKRLLKNKNIQLFEAECSFFNSLDSLYNQLSNYAHTKGVTHSSRKLTFGNTNTFSDKALHIWVEKYKSVIEHILALHFLLYPVGLQETPIHDKFGIDIPIGFLDEEKTRIATSIFSKKWLETLQSTSDADQDAISLSTHIRSLPDMTFDQIEVQRMKNDKLSIELHPFGYVGWEKFQISCMEHWNLSKDKHDLEMKRMIELKNWATENGFLESGGGGRKST